MGLIVSGFRAAKNQCADLPVRRGALLAGGNCEANRYQTFASAGTSEYICLAGAAVQFGIHGKRVFYCRAYH
ncbi:Uncharacterised protein [Mycobacteroides abscessus subsp. massiliense]|nr:Uncharacterised protein [Mycobacteroides abscessus subsp. massiliense]